MCVCVCVCVCVCGVCVCMYVCVCVYVCMSVDLLYHSLFLSLLPPSSSLPLQSSETKLRSSSLNVPLPRPGIAVSTASHRSASTSPHTSPHNHSPTSSLGSLNVGPVSSSFTRRYEGGEGGEEGREGGEEGREGGEGGKRGRRVGGRDKWREGRIEEERRESGEGREK